MTHRILSARKLATLVLAAASGLLTGCGSKAASPIPLSEVKGVVSYQGQPLANGTIAFMPVNGTNTATGDIVNGQYSLSTFTKADGAPQGDFRVAVTAWDKQPGMGVEGVPSIPRKYLDPKTSGLTATVSQENSQTIDFPLQAE